MTAAAVGCAPCSPAGDRHPTIRESGDIDVHMVTHSYVGPAGGCRAPARAGPPAHRPRLRPGRPAARRRRAALAPVQGPVTSSATCSSSLLMTVVVSLVGGLRPALVSAVLGSVVINYFFTPPLHTLSVKDVNNAVALFVFIAVAMLVSSWSTSPPGAPGRPPGRQPSRPPWPTCRCRTG